MPKPSTTLPDTAEPSAAVPNQIPAVPDIAEPSPARLPLDRTRYQLSLNEVARRFMEAGVPRSEKTLRRYCMQSKLDAVQSDGPTSREQWYVNENSVAPLIGELLQIHGRTDMVGHGAAVPGLDRPDIQENIQPTHTDIAEPSAAVPDIVQPEPKKEAMQPIETITHKGWSDLDIYEHPYVKKLEERNERLEAKYEAQVRRTEEVQTESQKRLVELQRMTTIGQSKTLADFMLQAKNWIAGNEQQDDVSLVDTTPNP